MARVDEANLYVVACERGAVAGWRACDVGRRILDLHRYDEFDHPNRPICGELMTCSDAKGDLLLLPGEWEQITRLNYQIDALIARMDHVLTNARKRMDQEEARAKAEYARRQDEQRAWRKQCVVPFLEVGCPPKEGAR